MGGGLDLQVCSKIKVICTGIGKWFLQGLKCRSIPCPGSLWTCRCACLEQRKYSTTERKALISCESFPGRENNSFCNKAILDLWVQLIFYHKHFSGIRLDVCCAFADNCHVSWSCTCKANYVFVTQKEKKLQWDSQMYVNGQWTVHVFGVVFWSEVLSSS